MTESELKQLIDAGEGAQVEFKRDGVRPEQLAKEIVALANMNGGRILLGVEDDGAVSGVRRRNPQEWLMDTVVGRHVTPQFVPHYEEASIAGATVAVITVPMGAAKPYAVRHGDRQDYYLRYGNVCRLATREQLLRLFESGGLLAFEKLPIHGSTADELDQRRLDDYLQPHISKERLVGTTRRRLWDYPPEVIRELVVNALAHRDWTRRNDIRLIVFGDRMEVTSPGALPNGMTIEKVRSGQQAPRNTNMVRILRDYGMMDDRGMGIRRKVIPLMREQNGSEPEFEATEDHFKVTLARPERI
ncbi:MAG: putative DNA binding domain-containing protein [Gammaproteobacteria bacterium]|nr:putative DNA binding domain-containing protein [Gammaproteobacteria bacterium]